ncbi:glutamyl-tRNA reductase [Wenyingzhuangia sp. 2_MG-2023]|uniref:glutamyl-tRNA reductase n=1 Tax=Wenyingzhuangia sp. 2_MG-2023 TaxID=3062639 RepID=UPI0026E2CA09|nr:glutamyl-tRNA reductase [Wenyingzhuangia sp. 2_MG-2023]MDO6739078.1 glutamyl-tRNA reductase [Wenyingzhuangia sp. 2_MG-2023]
MNTEQSGGKLYNVGVSYKKADVQTRSAFSLSKQKQIALLKDAKAKGIEGVIVVSTCNRTELTGFAKHPFELISLLCEFSNGTVEEFVRFSNIYKGSEAIQHLFNIGTGLESQILGDYEIVGQLKQSYQLAQKYGTINTYLERLMNCVLQASKEVKNTTKLSSGTTSVAYAATQYIIENVANYNSQRVLVYGLGEIGKNACKNLVKYTENNNIHLINRTHSRALEFAEVHENIAVNTLENLDVEIEDADVLIVSTGAELPTITTKNIKEDKKLLILDLSMPENVDKHVKELENITLVNVDQLSKITDKTLALRESEVPKAKAIIQKHKQEFSFWLDQRKFTPAVNALKLSLQSIQEDELNFHQKKIEGFNAAHAEQITSRIIQKITTQFVKHLKDESTSVDQSIEIVSKIFNAEIPTNG